MRYETKQNINAVMASKVFSISNKNKSKLNPIPSYHAIPFRPIPSPLPTYIA